MAQLRMRDRVRASLREETRHLRTVGDLMDFAETLHPPELRHLFVDMLTQMTTRPRWKDGHWVDREELRARHVGRSWRRGRMRTLNRSDSLDTMEVLAAISVRMQATEGYKAMRDDAQYILSLLAEHEFKRRKEGATDLR